jgi:hypothetical protein
MILIETDGSRGDRAGRTAEAENPGRERLVEESKLVEPLALRRARDALSVAKLTDNERSLIDDNYFSRPAIIRIPGP